ncbi:MAG: hypothetical protein JXR83_11445 [Deltaproteobacteria bacterium]|nr:hypothetical protein [Deltaproteobacteria bacterium]
MGRFIFMVLGLIGAIGCEQPDCRAVCERTLPCSVTFAPADDPLLRKVQSGERTALDSCEQGCRESLAVDDRSAQCLLAVETRDPDSCRAQLLDCLDAPGEAD